MADTLASPEVERTRLHADLVAMLSIARDAERDLFASLDAEQRDAPNTIGAWSAKDVLAHLAAWRSVEARRLKAAAAGTTNDHPDDPAPAAPIDEANALLHGQHADWPWERVSREADASVEALTAAIDMSSTTALCECDGTIAGIGANGVNHVMAHLSDVVRLGGDPQRFDAFAREVEAILLRNHLLPRDSGVILYNAACHRALFGELDEARRLLLLAFDRHGSLREVAVDDPDLVALRGELVDLRDAGPDSGA